MCGRRPLTMSPGPRGPRSGRVIVSRPSTLNWPHPPARRPSAHFPAEPVIGWIFGLTDHPAWSPDLPSFYCQTFPNCRLQLPPGDPTRARPRSSVSALAISKLLEYLGVSEIPPISFKAGWHFGGWSVRFGYGPPVCLPPVLIRPQGLDVPWAFGDFYFRASRCLVTQTSAGYDYGATRDFAPAGLSPASLAASFAA